MNLKKFEMAKRYHDDKKDRFDTDNVVVFLLMIGQCHGTMKIRLKVRNILTRLKMLMMFGVHSI